MYRFVKWWCWSKFLIQFLCQIGRSSEEQIDFTIVDTWLASGNGGHPSPCCGGHNKSRHSSHREEHSEQKTISSTISRYACRILAERDKPHRVFDVFIFWLFFFFSRFKFLLLVLTLLVIFFLEKKLPNGKRKMGNLLD